MPDPRRDLGVLSTGTVITPDTGAQTTGAAEGAGRVEFTVVVGAE